MFISDRGKQFYDIGGVTELDQPGDGRSFAILDYDRDGWQDIALVNANAPTLQLFRNQIGTRPDVAGKGHVIAVRLVGANRADKLSSASNRDAIGTMLTVAAGDLSIKREHRAGEGFAAQNSQTLIIGIGQRSKADKVSVSFPSGKVHEAKDLDAGTLITVYENPADSPTGQPFVSQDYAMPTVAEKITKLTSRPAAAKSLRLPSVAHGSQAKLRLYTTMTTWCSACKRELPQSQKIRELFGRDVVEMYGVPVDENEGQAQFKAYVAQYKPGYKLLMNLKQPEVDSVRQLVMDSLKFDGFPATVVTDSRGRVLRTLWGIPSASDLQRLLADTSSH